MAPFRWHPPPADLALGVGFYASGTEPIPGRIKSAAGDFEVRELSAYPVPDPSGPFTVLRVRSSDREQHELAQELARRLGLPPHAISWAGTKDRRAVSERLFSYRGSPPERLPEVPGASVIEVYRARDGLSLGHHYGNAFTVRVTGLTGAPTDALGGFFAVRDELRERGGFPNFFGPQRFGEVRPVTHLVGRALVLGRPEEAVDLYLTWLPPEGDAIGAEARREYAEHHDAARALQTFPPAFRFERVLLDHLARGHPATRAIGALSRELRTLFLHAYQALLFNRWVTRRALEGLSPGVPEVGDRLLRYASDGTVPGTAPVPVGSDNLSECRDLASRGRARVAGPLVGYETPVLEGIGGAILRSILSEEGVTPSDFSLPRSPGLASAGGWRPIEVPTPPIGISAEEGTGPGAPPCVALRLSLPKGAYATTLLREFLKPGATS